MIRRKLVATLAAGLGSMATIVLMSGVATASPSPSPSTPAATQGTPAMTSPAVTPTVPSSPSASLPLSRVTPDSLPCCGDFSMGSVAWNNSLWVHSTTKNNWYITNNGNQNDIHITNTGATGEIRDSDNFAECLTWNQTTLLIDDTTCANKASQEWTGTQCCSNVWWFTNGYTNAHTPCIQAGHSYEMLITASGVVSALTMYCPENGPGGVGTAQEFYASS